VVKAGAEVGIAVRYVTPEVIHESTVKQFALLVLGRGELGHFKVLAQALQKSGREGAN